MARLFVIALSLASLFASTFLILTFTGFLNIESIKAWLTSAQAIHPAWAALLVIGLLASDIFIAIPTLTITTLAGFLLGPVAGTLAAIIGMWLAGVTGYLISWRYGRGLIERISSPQQVSEMAVLIERYGALMLLICRAAPILPEVLCCLAGLNRLPFWRFFGFYTVGSAPYAALCALAGAHSSADNLTPAIINAVVLSSALGLCWWWFLRRNRVKAVIG